MSECREVQQYEREIAQAEEKARKDRFPLPGASYWTGVAETAKIGAHKAAVAHKIGKCTCQIRDYLDLKIDRCPDCAARCANGMQCKYCQGELG